MPLFDYMCPSCHKKDVDVLLKNRKESHKCTRCGATMKCLFPTSFNPHIWPSEGIYFEHTSAKGNTFYSKKEAKEFAKKNNLEMDVLS